jgi:hypothetical protein
MFIKNTFTSRIFFVALATAFSVAVLQPFKTKVNAQQSANLSAPYVGVWEGNGSQAGSSWTISITLTPGAVNSVVGTIAYPSLSCGGNLTLRRIKAQSIELAEEFTYGAKQCVRGIVVLQPSSDKKLKYKWLFPDGRQGATGSLRKSGKRITPAVVAVQRCGKNNTIRLTADSPEANFSGTLTAPGNGYQRYKITCIDVTNFPQAGKLVIDISLGNGVSGGSFDLFPRNVTIPTQGRPDKSLAGRYDISPGSSTQMIHNFDSSRIFQFGATGNWFSPKDSTNSYKARIFIDR